MKTKLLLIIAALLLTLTLAAGCTGSGDSGGDPTDSPSQGEGGAGGSAEGDDTEAEDLYADYLFADKTYPVLVFAQGLSGDAMSCVNVAMREAFDRIMFDTSDTRAETDHEILIGNTNRAISSKAYRAMRSVQKNSDYDLTYVIYAEGGSVAVAYEEGYLDLALEYSIQILAQHITGKTELKLDRGVVASGSFSAYEYCEEADREYYEQKWSALYEYAGEGGKEMVDAIKSLYANVYDPALVSWMANLYEPAIGGFYYSNSARDNVGYAPDIESTNQALGLITSLGLCRLHGSYKDVIARDTLKTIGNYIKSLQDPNGYFYNYQWTKESHGTSRLARDLGSSIGILQNCGMRPTYKTPTGQGGDGVIVPLPEAATPVALSSSSSVAVAVSKVVLAAHAPHLESYETLLEYLNNLEKNKGKLSFYAIGSNITSMMAQIINRDKELRAQHTQSGSSSEYRSLVDMVIEWFNARQNPETGHWENTSNYLAVNGILKISGIYRQAKVAMSYTDKMLVSAMDAISTDEVMTGIVDIYNAWSAVANVISNVREYGKVEIVDGVSTTGAQRAAAMREQMKTIAVPAIQKTEQKLLVFKKADGSFSYNPNSSAPNSQGMPVAIPGTNEGDLNATMLATSSIMNSLFGVLGLSEHKINIFGARELVTFLHIFENLGPVIKDTGSDTVSDEPIDFDSDPLGEEPVSTGVTVGGESSAIVIEDPRGDGNVLRLESAEGRGDYVYIANNGAVGGSCYVLEADINVQQGTGTYISQVMLGSHYMFTLHVINGKLVVREGTSTTGNVSKSRDLGSFELNEWFSIRIEYYKNAGKDGPRTKIYLNDTLVAVSDSFYGLRKQADGSYSGNPSQASMIKSQFYTMKDPRVTVLLDDLHCYTVNRDYVSEADPDGKLLFNADKD